MLTAMWYKDRVVYEDFPSKLDQLDNGPTARTLRSSPWHSATAVQHCLCPDGIRRRARITALEPDSAFSQAASVCYKGKTVTGYITGCGGDTVFHPVQTRKNYGLFPEVTYEYYETWQGGAFHDVLNADGRAYAKPIRLLWAVYVLGIWQPLNDCTHCANTRRAASWIKNPNYEAELADCVAKGIAHLHKPAEYLPYNHELTCYRCQIVEHRFESMEYATPSLGVCLLPANKLNLYTMEDSVYAARLAILDDKCRAMVSYVQEYNSLPPSTARI